MFNKGKFFAVTLLSAAACAGAFAQTKPTTPNAPQRVERQVQIFTNNDGGSYLGVQSQDVNKENFSKFGLREVRGVAVEKVLENSPAANAGLQNGDVIVRFNGEEVTGVRKLTRLIGETAPDHQAKITVLRGGSERDLTATLSKRPTPTFQTSGSTLKDLYGFPGIPEYPTSPRTFPIPDGTTIVPSTKDGENTFIFGSNRQIGVGVSSLNKQLGEYFGVGDGKGVLINNVTENSAAAKAGLRAGDVIIEADGKAISGTADLTRAINEKKEGDVTLTIIRSKIRQTVKVTPEKKDYKQLLELYRQENGNSGRALQELLKARQVDYQKLLRQMNSTRTL
ncbi:MAG: PDZ domain-containing protein [Pyrinomonadaceae bacterium]